MKRIFALLSVALVIGQLYFFVSDAILLYMLKEFNSRAYQDIVDTKNRLEKKCIENDFDCASLPRMIKTTEVLIQSSKERIEYLQNELKRMKESNIFKMN